MHRCAHCTLHPAYYCGRQCQQRHWRVHKHTCQSRVAASDYVLVSDTTAASRRTRPGTQTSSASSGDEPSGTASTSSAAGSASSTPIGTNAASPAADTTRTTTPPPPPPPRFGPFDAAALEAYNATRASLRAAESELSRSSDDDDASSGAGAGGGGSAAATPADAAASEASKAILRQRVAELRAQLEASPIHPMTQQYERLTAGAADYFELRERSTERVYERLVAGAAAMRFEPFGERDVADVEQYLEAVLGEPPRAEPTSETAAGGDDAELENIERGDWDGLYNLERAYRDLARRVLAAADRGNTLQRAEFDMLDKVRRDIEDLVDAKAEFARAPTRQLESFVRSLQRSVDLGLIDAGKQLGVFAATTPDYGALPAQRLDADADLAVLEFDMRMQRVLSFGAATIVAESERIVAALRAAVAAESKAGGDGGVAAGAASSSSATARLLEDVAEKFADVAKRAQQVNLADADTRLISEALAVSGAEGEKRRADQIAALRRAAEADLAAKAPRTTSLPPSQLPGVLQPEMSEGGVSPAPPPPAAAAAAQLVGNDGSGTRSDGGGSASGTEPATTTSVAIEALNELLLESSSWPAMNGIVAQFLALVARLDEIGTGERLADTQPALLAVIDTVRKMNNVIELYRKEDVQSGAEMRHMLEAALIYVDGRVPDRVRTAAERQHERLLRFLDSTTVRTLVAMLGVAAAARTLPSSAAPPLADLAPMQNAVLPGSGSSFNTPFEYAPTLAAHCAPFQTAALVISESGAFEPFLDGRRKADEAFDAAATTTTTTTGGDAGSRIGACVTFPMRENGATATPGTAACDEDRRNLLKLVYEVAGYHREQFNGNSLDEFRTLLEQAANRGDDVLDACGAVSVAATKDTIKGRLFLRHLRAARFESEAARSVGLVGDLARAVFTTLLTPRLGGDTEATGEIERAREQLERTDQALALSALNAALFRVETHFRNSLLAEQVRAIVDRDEIDELQAAAAAAAATPQRAASSLSHVQTRALDIATFIRNQVRADLAKLEATSADLERNLAGQRAGSGDSGTAAIIATLRVREREERKVLAATLRELEAKFDENGNGGAFVLASNSQRFMQTLPALVGFFRQATTEEPAFADNAQRELVFGALVSPQMLGADADAPIEQGGLTREEVSALGGETFRAAMHDLYGQLIKLATRNGGGGGGGGGGVDTEAAVLVMRRWRDTLEANNVHDAIYLMRQMRERDEMAFADRELGGYLTGVGMTSARATLGSLASYYDTLPAALSTMALALTEPNSGGAAAAATAAATDAVLETKSVLRGYELDGFTPLRSGASPALAHHRRQSGEPASGANAQVFAVFDAFVDKALAENKFSPQLQRHLTELRTSLARSQTHIQNLCESISWFSALLALLLARGLLGLTPLLRLERRRRLEQIAEGALDSFARSASSQFDIWRSNALGRPQSTSAANAATAEDIALTAKRFEAGLRRARDEVRATHNAAFSNTAWTIFERASVTGAVAITDYFVLTRLTHISYAAWAQTPLLGWMLQPFVGQPAFGYAALATCAAMQTVVVVPVHRMAAAARRTMATSATGTFGSGTAATAAGLVDVSRTAAHTEYLVEASFAAIFAGSLTALVSALGLAVGGTSTFEYDSVTKLIVVGLLAGAVRVATASAEAWSRRRRAAADNK